MHFTDIDWIIVVVYMSAMIIVGIYCQKYIKEMSHFAVAGRKVRKFLLAAGGSAAEVGLIAIMFLAQEAYVHGLAALILPVYAGVSQYLIGRTGFCIYRFRQVGAVTMGHFAEMRYGRRFRIFSGAFQFLAVTLVISMFPIMAGTFITYYLGFPESLYIMGLKVPTVAVVTAVLLASITAYTIAGGLISVAVTDFMQFIILWLAMIIVTGLVVRDCTFSRIVEAVKTAYGSNGLNPLLSSTTEKPGYGIFFLIWMVFQYSFGAIVWAPIALRVSSSQSPKVAKQMYLITSLLQPGRNSMIMLWGLAALALLPPTSIPQNVLIGDATLVAMPIYLGKIVPPIVAGLVFAGMLAAHMSTVSSYTMACSAVATQDVILPLLGQREISQRTKVWITRLIIIGLAVFMYIWGLCYRFNNTLFAYIMMAGVVYMPGAGAFLAFGVYWKRANHVGAYTAMVIGSILPLISIFVKFRHPRYDYMAAAAAFVLALLAMYIGSLVGEKYFSVKPKKLSYNNYPHQH